MTPLGPPDPSKKEVIKKNMRFCIFFGSFSLFFTNKMRFLAENVCFSVLATKISYLQQNFFLVRPTWFRTAQTQLAKILLFLIKNKCYATAVALQLVYNFYINKVSYDLDQGGICQGWSSSIVLDGTGIRSILRSIFFVLPDYHGLRSNANSCKFLSVLIL